MATLKRKTNNGYEPLPAMVVRKTNAENGNGIGTCSTSSGTALTVSLTGYELVTNGFVAVTFSNDVPASATLNINSKGAKPIIYKGSAITADTIKADDTVMFAYDGTNYVVTSLGGDGGTIVWPEFVTIQLTQSGGSDSDLIGATVVVTNDDTSFTILSTTWQGNGIAVQIGEGIDYTVTVGNVTDYTTPNTQSYTALSGLTRVVSFKYLDANIVDMGLPSGTLWARKNIDASQPNGFAASEYQYECSFFSWGNVAGHNPISTSAFSYNFGNDNTGPYASTPGAALTGNIPTNSTYDCARALPGSSWRLPTIIEYSELLANVNFVQADGTTVITSGNKVVTVNGVSGFYMKSKNNGNLLFFPFTGRGLNTTWDWRGARGLYMTSTLKTSTTANRFYLYGDTTDIEGETSRFYGLAVRPVM